MALLQQFNRAATQPRTWLIAFVLLALIDVSVTRTDVLWGKTNTWVGTSQKDQILWQIYETARNLRGTGSDASIRTAILGSSIAWYPARDVYVERELSRTAPGITSSVENLSFFGARIDDIEIVARQLQAVDPSLVVIGLSGLELVEDRDRRFVHDKLNQMLEVGWADGPIPPPSSTARLERWLRTAWPLYRYRTLIRYVVEDRLLPSSDHQEFPQSFASRSEFFDFTHGARGGEINDAYEAFRSDRCLESFSSYLSVRRGGTWIQQRSFSQVDDLTADSIGIHVLDSLLRLASKQPWKTLVLMMPRNPLLDRDLEGKYFPAGLSERATDLARSVARRNNVDFVDGRRWLPADAFMDFQHLFPDSSGFHEILAREILRAHEI